MEAEITISDKLLDKYRYINTEGMDWWDCVYEGFKEDMSLLGIEVDRMYFSGFWSQGDGACFEGRITDWPVYLKSLGYDSPVVHQHAAQHWSFYVKHSGHYYHENCTTFDGDLALSDGWDKDDFIQTFSPYPEDDVRSLAWYAVLQPLDGEKLEVEFKENLKSHMRDLYKKLEEEYEHLTSDEVVQDTIIANELHIGEHDDDE